MGGGQENTRLRHDLARLHRKTLRDSKSLKMLAHSVRLLIHDLKFEDVPVPPRPQPFSSQVSNAFLGTIARSIYISFDRQYCPFKL